MRRMLMAAVTALACGCGTSTGLSDGGTGNTVDNAPAFVGTWNGTLTETETAPSAGTPQSATVSLGILEVKANTLALEATCPDSSNVVATVTSATEFSIGSPYACPTTTVSSCTTVVFTYSTLTGMLSGGALSMAGVVTAVGCGVSASSNISFSSTAKN